MATRETKGRYEMLWDCAACGTEGLLGLTHRFCPNCGAPQDPSKRYFPPEDKKVAVEDNPYQGADVICGGCDTPNAAKAAFCVACGASLEGAKAAGVRAEKRADATDGAGDAAREAEARRKAERDAAMQAHAQASGVPPAAKSGGRGIVAFLAVGVLLLACAGVLTALFWRHDTGMRVAGHTWARSIEVMELRTESDSAWKDQVPADAAGVACTQAQRDTKKVEDGKTCVDKHVDKGDGTFETVQDCSPKYRDEPVYDDKCTFTVDRWKKADEVKTAGSALTPAPTWPADPPTTGAGPGARKPGDRHETYTVAFSDPAGKAYACDLPQDRWQAMTDGSSWTGSVGVVTGALDCGALQPAK